MQEVHSPNLFDAGNFSQNSVTECGKSPRTLRRRHYIYTYRWSGKGRVEWKEKVGMEKYERGRVTQLVCWGKGKMLSMLGSWTEAE